MYLLALLIVGVVATLSISYRAVQLMNNPALALRKAQRNLGEMHIFAILNLGGNRYFASKDFGEMKNLSIFAWTNICNDGK